MKNRKRQIGFSLALGTLSAGLAFADVPVPMVWQFNAESLSRRQYLRDVDFIKENTLVDLLAVAPVGHVNPEDPDQFHDAFKEMVEYAKAKGIRVVLRGEPNMKGFFNAGVDGADAGTYVIENQSEAQGIAYETVTNLDTTGFVSVTETAKWGRNKLRPLRNELLAVYAFDRTGDGFYRPGSLVDITGRARIVARTSAGILSGRNRLHAAQRERHPFGKDAAVARTLLLEGAGGLVADEPEDRPDAASFRHAPRAAGRRRRANPGDQRLHGRDAPPAVRERAENRRASEEALGRGRVPGLPFDVSQFA